MSIAKVLEWAKCEWSQPKPSVRRKCFQGSDNMTITMGVVAPGHPAGPHRHSYEQTVVILKGKCDFFVEDEKYTLSGQVEDGGISFMTIPPNALHWIENPYGEPVYNMDIFAPKRTEDREESVPVK